MVSFSSKVNEAARGETHLFSLGQAGFILKSSSGQSLAIDLYLSDIVEDVEGHDGFHRLMPKIVEPEELDLDVLIATHFHRDHFDIGSIAGLMSNGHTRLLCAYDCRKDVEDLGIDRSRVTYVKPGDSLHIGDFIVNFVHSDHGSGAPLEVGVLVTVDGKNILDVGDTSMHLDWKEEYLQCGALDLLIAPINGSFGNLNEMECAQLAECIDPKMTIPSHYGMFASHRGDPGIFIEKMRSMGIPYRIMTMGEGITL